MVAEGKGATFQFKLDAINALLPVISNCVAKVKANGIASASDFSLPVAAPMPQSKATLPPSIDNSKSEKTFEQDGTGFVVSAAGHVVTNNHVIIGCVGDISAKTAQRHGNHSRNCCSSW